MDKLWNYQLLCHYNNYLLKPLIFSEDHPDVSMNSYKNAPPMKKKKLKLNIYYLKKENKNI